MRTTAAILEEYRQLAQRANGASITELDRLAKRETELVEECRRDHGTTLGAVITAARQRAQ